MLKRQRPIIHRSGLLQLPPIASDWTNHLLLFGCIVSNLRIPILIWSLCCFASSFLETGQLLQNHETVKQTMQKIQNGQVMYDASNLLWAVICLDNVWILQRSKSKKCNKRKRTLQTEKRDSSMQLLSEMSSSFYVLPIFSLLLFSPDLMELSTLLWQNFPFLVGWVWGIVPW